MCSAEVPIRSCTKWPYRPTVPTWDDRHGHRAHVGVTVEARALITRSGAHVGARSIPTVLRGTTGTAPTWA
jgi:hypothetical protein